MASVPYLSQTESTEMSGDEEPNENFRERETYHTATIVTDEEPIKTPRFRDSNFLNRDLYVGN